LCIKNLKKLNIGAKHNLTLPNISNYECHFGRYVYPTYSFIQGGDGGMEYGMCTMILGEARSLEGLLGLMIHEGATLGFSKCLLLTKALNLG
jgi:hypothetical protein